MPRVLISAGHTNQDPGTVIDGIREVDLTRQIAQAITKELRQSNIITLAVPPNLDLANRIQWINQTGYNEESGDVCLEVHINDGNKQGIEAWFKDQNEKSEKFTKAVVDSVVKELNWTNQGVNNEKKHPFGSLAFLDNTKPISTLVECGYLDNDKDREFLKDSSNIEKLAKALANGIKNFLNQSSNKQEETTTLATRPQTTPASTNTPVQTTPQPAPSPSPYTPPSPRQMGGGFGSQYNYPSSSGSSFGGPRTTPSQMSGGSSTGYMSREERREMIQNNYIKILGREPSQSDLNYFLNIGIVEDQLIKKMVDSQEHADLVKSRQEIIKTKEQFINHKNELMGLRAKVNDQKGIIKNLNLLLIQKNKAIQELNQKLQMSSKKNNSSSIVKEEPAPPKSLQQRILDYFSEKFS